MTHLRAADWCVRDVAPAIARGLVADHHYAGGSSHTRVYSHGLFRNNSDECMGAAIWLPPTRRAAESVNRDKWKQVLSLSRLVVVPGVPTNACSFILAKSTKLIRQDGRFVSLVTYADESQGHDGAIYRAANWEYVGRMPATPRWIDIFTGRQVAKQSTKTRTNAQMEALGYYVEGTYHKHKFVLHLKQRSTPMLERDLFA